MTSAPNGHTLGAICPKKGKGAGLVMPWCDTPAMAAHLAEISAAVDPSWDEGAWHPESVGVHGIPRAALDAANPADLVACWAVDFIGERVLVSDAPEFDQRWLDRLLDTVTDPPNLTIRDFDQAVAREFDTAACHRIYGEYVRPIPDALRMARAWKIGLSRPSGPVSC